MAKKIYPLILVLLIFGLALPPKTLPCIGRILSLGITGNEDQKVMAEILSVLISESTGTKVNIVEFQTLEECRNAMKNEELDLYLDYVCSGLISLDSKINYHENSGKAFSAVKHLFAQKFSFIWLKPFGYDNPKALSKNAEEIKNISNQAVCVARKKVLNRFPILPRLINKLKNKIPNDTLKKLEESEGLRDSVKDFLASKKIIRWSIPQ